MKNVIYNLLLCIDSIFYINIGEIVTKNVGDLFHIVTLLLGILTIGHDYIYC